jgi:SAM-dependent methyltransferase
LVDRERAIQLGHPSYVWRAGQERRLDLVRQHVPLQRPPEGLQILDIGCGLGMYTQAFSRYSEQVYGTEVEHERAVQALERATGVVHAVGECLPFRSNTFDLVFNNEVIEHVSDDRQTAREMVRVTRPGGHVVTFCPNRLWPFETHGIFWRGQYSFGNKPLVNYLPNSLRNRLAPHVRVYTRRSLLALFDDLPVQVRHVQTAYPGFDNVVERFPRIGPLIRSISYMLEGWPLFDRFGLSHFLIVQKQ